MSTQASRPAAAAFFFELLVLGSRGCIALDQAEAYKDINVAAKPKLWDVVGRENMAPTSNAAESTPLATPIAGR